MPDITDVCFLAMVGSHAVVLVPMPAEILTWQAADILNVPRPCLVKLLEQLDLEYTKFGTRIRCV